MEYAGAALAIKNRALIAARLTLSRSKSDLPLKVARNLAISALVHRGHGKAFPALGAAAVQDGPSPAGFHFLAESVRFDAARLRGLICSFGSHGNIPLICPCIKTQTYKKIKQLFGLCFADKRVGDVFPKLNHGREKKQQGDQLGKARPYHRRSVRNIHHNKTKILEIFPFVNRKNKAIFGVKKLDFTIGKC
jgi:hypothetical protein